MDQDLLRPASYNAIATAVGKFKESTSPGCSILMAFSFKNERSNPLASFPNTNAYLLSFSSNFLNHDLFVT